MIDTPWKWPLFKPLTPQQVQTYLTKKPQYKSIRNQLVPHFFGAQEFCNFVNQIRIKRIEEAKEIDDQIEQLNLKKDKTEEDEKRIKALKIQKNTIFPNTLRQVFDAEILPRIRNTNVDFKETNQLIGSLANFNRVKKEEIQEISEAANKQLHEDLTMDIYEEEIFMIMDDLIHQFFIDQELGNQPSEGEKRDYGQQAWNIFLSRHKEEVEKKKIDIKKLKEHLYKKKVL